MQKLSLVIILSTLMFIGCGSDDSGNGDVSSSSASSFSSASLQSSLSSDSLSSLASSDMSSDASSADSVSSASSAAPAPVVRLTQFVERENGYHTFDTVVIDSLSAHEAFIDALTPQSSWNDKDAFLDAMNTLQIDYGMANLLLFRHTETSGSNVVTLHEPEIDGVTAVIVVDRYVPGSGTDDMAYYLYAYRVSKTITQVTFIVDGTPIAVANRGPAVCTEQYQPVCADQQVICVTAPCDPIPTTYSNLCFMQSDPLALYRYDGECEANSTERSVTDPSAIVRSTERFGHALMQAYLDPSENLFLSPFSIISALSMTYAGAYSTSADEFETLFHYDANLSVHNSFAALLPRMVPEHNTFTVANSIWPQKEYPFYPAFMTTVSQKYGSSVFPTDFVNDTTANETINEWVEQQTNEKIKDLIPEPLPASTAMVLVNAIYFLGTWAIEFNATRTAAEPFTLFDANQTETEIMHLTADLNYTENSVFQAVDLAYAEREFSMQVFVPKTGHSLPEIEEYLGQHPIATVVETMSPAYVDLALPKFKIKWGTEDLTPALVALGLESPFNAGVADFRLMADIGVGDIFISKVLHQTFVDVNEAGTEAAAATAVSTDFASEEPPPPIDFRADRPFLFFIRDNRTGMLLFSGLLADPTQN